MDIGVGCLSFSKNSIPALHLRHRCMADQCHCDALPVSLRDDADICVSLPVAMGNAKPRRWSCANMRINRRLAGVAGIVLGAALLVGGCNSIRNHRGYIVDQALVDAVQPGIDNRQSVERTLGRPTFISQFGSKDWFYVSQDTRTFAFRRPRTHEQIVLRVAFDPAGNVTAVDRKGVELVARIDPESDHTPTLGRDRSFIEDLFGNVGAVGAGGGGAAAPTGPGPNGS
jgi:outer membrane protein assembly factor BamE (lipoprotein component of BamABCDE complex)